MPRSYSRPRSILQRWLGSNDASHRPLRVDSLRHFETLESRDLLSITAGPETRVNNVVNEAQQTFFESNRTVAMNSAGRSVVVWSSFGQDTPTTWGVFMQIYNENGQPVGSTARVNEQILFDQRLPTVAMADDGSFVVTWTSNQGDLTTPDVDVYARRFNATGVAQTGEFKVNTTLTGDQQFSRIAMAADGTFVITWTSGAAQGSSTTRPPGDVFFQRYDATATKVGTETRVNTTLTGDQSFSTVAMADDRSFVVTWSGNQLGNYDIYFRRYNTTGTPVSAETLVNETLIGNQTNSDIAVDATGSYAVTWTSDGALDGSGTTVLVKLYSPSMVAFTSEIQANSFTDNDQRDSTIATDAAGNFVVTWSSNLQDGSGWAIEAQRFNFLGDKIGDEFQVNVFMNGDQRYGTVASNAAGSFIIVWSSLNQVSATSSWDIFSRRYTQIKPTARDDSATTPKNTPVTVNVLSNDSPPAGATLVPGSVLIVTPASNGTAVVNVNGSITYTPIVGFIGIDTFQYVVADNTGTFSDPATVTITVTGVPPVAVNDSAITPEDTPVVINVLANDSATDGTLNPATVTIVTAPQHGTVSINTTTGAVTYTPTLNYNGPDSFTYTVRDSNNQLSNVATVSITVTPVNDAPTANNDNAVTNRDVPVVINILANDTDPDSPIDPSSVVIVTPPANGTTSINPVTGAVTYTPNPGFTGTNTFTYTVKDTAGATSNVATVTIRVNNPPIAVNDTATTPEDVPVAINILANDTDTDGTLVPSSVTIVTGPLHGTLVINPSTGVVTYTPNENYNGADSFTYTVRDNDGAVSNVATVSITILAVNDPPVAVDDPTTTDIGVPVVIDVLANDTDVDGTLVPSSVTIVSGPTNGTATINPVTGAITYTPNPGFVGGDLIVYTVKDNLGATSNQANVPIRVGLPSVIAGKVFLDTNNNGVQDVGEAGIVGVSLTLLKTDGPITFVRNTVTGADGSYSFIDLIPGTYTLVQSQPGVFLDGIETPAPGIPVGSITNDQFIDIQLGSGVNATGFNFAERGLKAEFLASYQGARVFLASGMGGTLNIFAEPAAGLSLAAGDIWISLDGGYSGPLKFLATPSGGTASLTLYDSNLNAVASSVPGSGAASFTYQGTTGSPYFLRVSGTSTNVEVSALDPTPDPVNVAPVLPPIGNQTVQPGQTLSFIAKATDANAGDKLTYALAGTIPAGASIDPVTGKFTWAAPANFQGSVSFTIVVMDNGSPVMSDWETFDVVAGQVTTPGITAADANAFVRSLYVDLLGRNADSGGLNQHVQRLLAGTSRQEIVASFVNSTEYLGRVVDGMYTKYLRRTADAAGRSSWIAAMSAGTTATDVAIAFLSSSEYASRHVSNAAFVDGLYRDVLGRAPDAGGYNSNVTKLQSGGSRAALAKFFLTSGERVDQVIAEQYGKVLGRAVDPTGKLSFAAALAGSLDAADELATALASSQEYLTKAIRKFR